MLFSAVLTYNNNLHLISDSLGTRNGKMSAGVITEDLISYINTSNLYLMGEPWKAPVFDVVYEPDSLLNQNLANGKSGNAFHSAAIIASTADKIKFDSQLTYNIFIYSGKKGIIYQLLFFYICRQTLYVKYIFRIFII